MQSHFLSASPTPGAFSGQSRRPGQSQFQQPHLPRACFECGDISHMVRDCPRLRRGAPPQTAQAPRISQGSQTMVAALIAAPPAPLARGGCQEARGHPRGGGHAHFYAFSGRTEAVASDAVIPSIVLICHRDASVLFDLGSTYSYVSSYFARYLDIPRDSLSAPVYVSMHVGDSIVVDCVYQSCLVTISGYETRVDLLLLGMVDFDMILGMD
ncbi:uncharacterized protein [Nicotiana tomentosiformis]|uniref:uncharacterized protein n=1 Tax=Nicotiana tomentosiformis TaxID=4098 RepID=UPI00388C5D56